MGQVISYEADLFSPVILNSVEAIAQGCNTLGVMGAGLAKRFRQRYPLMYKNYRILCQAGKLRLGMCYYWRDYDIDNKFIFNLMTQANIGRYAKADLNAICQSVSQMLYWCKEFGVSKLALPHIGCGLGHLDWQREVAPIVMSISKAFPIDIYVCTLPQS